MKRLIFLSVLIVPGAVAAQAGGGSGLSYSYAELRFVDVDDNGGDGLRLNGSFELNRNWIILGGITDLNFNRDVDQTVLEIGGGYVYPYREGFDLLATLRFVKSEVDTPFGDADDSGFAISGGTRGLIAPQFEVRGSVNHINVDDSDTFLEVAADYHFTAQLSAGISVEFVGDNDALTFGARWYFR